MSDIVKDMVICPVCATEFEAIAKDAEIERLRGLLLEACRSLELCDRWAAGREFREALGE